MLTHILMDLNAIMRIEMQLEYFGGTKVKWNHLMCSTLSTINVTLTYPFILITFIRLIGIYSNDLEYSSCIDENCYSIIQ